MEGAEGSIQRKAHRPTCSSVNEYSFQSARATLESDDGTLPTAEPMQTAADSIITLCVGGTEFATTMGTLTAVPGSYFATLFGSPRWTPSVFVPGTQIPFIDRDHESFKHVLAYLRCVRYADSQLVLPESTAQLRRLHSEAEYYGLPGLAQACSLGKWSSTCVGTMHKQPPSLLSGELQTGIYREPTFSFNQEQNSSGRGVSSSLAAILQAERDAVRHAQHSNGGASAYSSGGGDAAAAPVTGEDVQISMQQQTGSPGLLHCMCTAQQLLAVKQATWAANSEWKQLADLTLKHLLHLPLAAQQPDLVVALAHPIPANRLEFLLQYFPVGDVRIDVECRIVPDGTDTTAVIAAATAAVAAHAVAASNTPSPHMSPRERPSRAASAGSVGMAAVAAAGDAASAETGSAAGATPGPGWGGVTPYHRYSIRETSENFIMTTHMPGEPQAVTAAPRAAFKQELKMYSTLHKLLVQQAPRDSVAGLMWLLESAGFSSVKLSTVLDTYYVGNNAFPGYKSVIAFQL